jgi:hypothetical protein
MPRLSCVQWWIALFCGCVWRGVDKASHLLLLLLRLLLLLPCII